MAPHQDEQYEPLDDWLSREGVSVATLLFAEREGYRLPVWFPDRKRALVNTTRGFNWLEIIKIMNGAADQKGAA